MQARFGGAQPIAWLQRIGATHGGVHGTTGHFGNWDCRIVSIRPSPAQAEKLRASGRT